MERGRVVAATTSAFGAVAVGVCAIGLNIGVLRAGRTLHKIVVTNSADPTTSDSPTSAELVVEDLVPLVIPLNALTGAAPADTAVTEGPTTAAASAETAAPSEETSSPPEAEPENDTDTATSAAPPAAPASATTVEAPEPTQPGHDQEDETSEDPTTSQPAPGTQPAATSTVKSQSFTLPRQAGIAQIGVGSTSLILQQVQLAPGWNYSCEDPQGHEIQLKLTGPGGNFEFTIKLENGHVTTEGG